ncbi:hypothetical protein Dimus_024768, partial [Dionaea muscipula]
GRRAMDVNTKKTKQPQPSSSTPQKIKNSQESTLGPTSREADFPSFSELERKRANKFHDELEKAKAENAKLLALLHKTQTKPHP